MNKAPVEIRCATPDDLANIQSCARVAYTRYIERMDREPAPMLADFASQIDSGYVYVALNDSSFAGYVVFYPEEDHLHLENVAVNPTHAGRGIGKMLVKYVEQTARARSLNAVELYTNEVMTENLKIYVKLGYTEIARNQQNGFNRVFFRKLINQ